MELTHYGVHIDSEIPIVGVVTNHEPEFLIEEVNQGVDIDWVEYEADCEFRGIEIDDPDWCQGTTIVGFVESPMRPELVLKHNHLAIEVAGKAYVADPDAEYQAICGEVYTQILSSRYVQRCALCSPCYPGQGDLDSPVGERYRHHNGFMTFTLPPSVWGERKDWRLVSLYDPNTRGEYCYG